MTETQPNDEDEDNTLLRMWNDFHCRRLHAPTERQDTHKARETEWTFLSK